MIRLILLTILIFPLCLKASEYHFEDYDWQSERGLTKLSDEEKSEFELIIKDKRVIEYLVNDKKGIIRNLLVHKIIRVNSNDAIEQNNKIYLPVSAQSKLLITKARVINSSGKVAELNQDNILEKVDEESQSTYYYFALEGIDIGSEIEYFYIVQEPGLSFTGGREILQTNVPKKETELEILSPKHLVFTSKSLNGFPEMVKDTLEDGTNRLHARAEDIVAREEEEFATYTPNLMQVLFKLQYNTAQNANKPVVNYGKVAETVYANQHQEISKATEKGIQKLLKEIKVEKNESIENKVRKVEHYLKMNFQVIESGDPQLKDIDKILGNRYCNAAGMTNLMVKIFEAMNIEQNAVLTCSRNNIKFDKGFESYLYLKEYLMYFPEIDLFLAPSKSENRLGYIPPNWMNTYGLFIKPVSLGDFKSAVAKVNFIDPLGAEKNKDNLEIEVDFSNSIEEPTILVERVQTGYYAHYLQLIGGMLNEGDNDKLMKELVSFIATESEVKSVNLENASGVDCGVKPLIIKAEMATKSKVEKAGSKYLFKVGELIGPQAELYSESKRHFKVENEFNRVYKRIIKFKVPEGYKVLNLEDLNLDYHHANSDGVYTMAFVSSFEENDGDVKITIDEYYNQIDYKVEDYEAFRKVINAAADFNKVVLIFEKKS